MSSKFYQNLLDKCWRRSGKLLYRPNQRQSCCPHYTIRLDSSQFKPTRDQRQTLNRFNKYIMGDDYVTEAARKYPKSKEEAKKRNNDFNLLDRIHEAEHAQLKQPPQPAHKFEVTLETNEFTEEKYAVYDNYQMAIHKDEPGERTRRSFTRFLCTSPLRRETVVGPDGRKKRLGSYHQCYRLDGKLVAIGVVDLLPECVSSVYFLYDQSIHQHSPGKLGALHEIALAMEEGYRWWYPGYYIHNCAKMRYKNDYSPQYILDPESLSWDLLDKSVLKLLDDKPFLSLSLERQKQKRQEENTSTAAGESKSSNGTANDDEASGGIRISLFHSTMPGIPTVAEVDNPALDVVGVKLPSSPRVFTTADLVGWEDSGVEDWPGIKAQVAEMVAAMGLDSVHSICLSVGRQQDDDEDD